LLSERILSVDNRPARRQSCTTGLYRQEQKVDRQECKNRAHDRFLGFNKIWPNILPNFDAVKQEEGVPKKARESRVDSTLLLFSPEFIFKSRAKPNYGSGDVTERNTSNCGQRTTGVSA
jgi:hypothetical protein